MRSFIAMPLLLLLFGTAARADGRPPLTVGQLTLSPCGVGYGAYCGSFTRPLDPSGGMPGTLSIGFEWYPRRDLDAPPLGTIVAQEGGPGYSTTGSRDGYVRLFDALRDRRDILLMDKRGTGKSGALHCPSLQVSGSATAAQYKACGDKLGPAAWFYASRFAADDLAALLDKLGRGKVDYYGDSYGTYVGQVFVRRHPEHIRTAVLDSAYPDGVRGASPWFPTEYNVTPVALDTVCARSPTCANVPGDPVERLERLVALARSRVLAGTAPNASGGVSRVTADPPALFTLFDFAGNTPITWRDADAATRALLDQGDKLPFLRLVSESLDSNGLGGSASKAFSNALATAVICADYPQLSDPYAPPAQRHMQYDKAVAAKMADKPDLYAPFTIAEAIAAPFQPLELGVCLDWPKPPPGAGPEPPHGPGPAVPMLVLNGEIDTITSVAEGRDVAAAFPGATYVSVANAIHEVAIGDGGYFVPPYGYDFARCAGPIVLNFVRNGGGPVTPDCAGRVRPIRTPAAFVRHASAASLPEALPGHQAPEVTLRIASAATETIGDALARYFQLGTKHGVGLRAGTFVFMPTDTGYAFTLNQAMWTEDLAVSGTIAWNQVTGDIAADVTLSGVATGTLHVAWNDRQTDATATLTGTIDGRAVEARRLAP